MNNYLETIVARTLNPTSPLRPRLRGRFEETPALQLHLEGSKKLRSGPPQAVPPSQTTEHSGVLNTARPDENYPSTLSLDPTHPAEQKSGHGPLVSRAAAPVTDQTIDPSKPGPVASVSPPARTETSPQAPDTSPPSIKKISETHVQSEPTGLTLPPRLPEKTPEPQREKIPFRFPAPDDHAAVSNSTLEPRHSPNVDKTSQRRDGEADELPRSRRRNQKELKGREVERIIIREQSAAGEPRQKTTAAPAPTPTIPALSQINKSRDAGVEPAAPSRIAPRIDNGAEQLTLKRRNAPAQPTVHVTIGRLEVRAVQSSHVRPKPQTAGPVMNLEDYLRRRSQGGTR